MLLSDILTGIRNSLVQVQLGHPLVTDGLEESLLMRLSAGFSSSSHLSLSVFHLGLGLGRGVHVRRLDSSCQVCPLSDHFEQDIRLSAKVLVEQIQT